MTARVRFSRERRSLTRFYDRSAATERSSPATPSSCNAHPAVVDFMQTEEKAAVEEAGRRFQRRITLNARTEYHIEQFDLQGK